MSDSYGNLIKDTVRYLKQEGKLQKKGSPPPPKTELPRPPTRPSPIPPPCPIPEPSPPPLPKEETTPLFEKIQKHLPHIRLVKNTPRMQEIAIVYTEEKDLPFLEKLGKAIEQRFFPVKILSSEPMSPYSLVLTQKELMNTPQQMQILLEPIENYENNTEKKKQLWAAICHRLSQKSS